MLICYREKRFGADRTKMIEQANAIITEYQGQGYDLTLRQLYYQFVSRDLIKNCQSEYKRLGDVVNDGRLAGLISWKAIVDRTRNLQKQSVWNSPKEILEAVADQYKSDRWEGQKNYVEVWIEKDALVGVIENVCQEFQVPYFSCRGYTSQSEMWEAAQRLGRKLDEPGRRQITVLHFGDHDPSGIDMSRDIEDRLCEFAPEGSAGIEIRRIALNMGQVDQYNPPPNFAKATDARFEDYRAKFGEDCWELDALEPSVIEQLIRDEITPLIDLGMWKDSCDADEDHKARLLEIAEEFSS